ncbi:MAG: hypothetical protein ACR2OD_08100 [Gaiellaceae bacterium]
MGLIALVLLIAAIALVATAEWPRLQERLGLEAREQRQREKRKARFRVVDGLQEPDAEPKEKPPEPADDFAASVQRDLENLPVVDPRDDR